MTYNSVAVAARNYFSHPNVDHEHIADPGKLLDMKLFRSEWMRLSPKDKLDIAESFPAVGIELTDEAVQAVRERASA